MVWLYTTLFFLLSFTLSAQNKYHLNSYNTIHCLKVQGDYLWAGTTKGLVQRDKHTGVICGIYNASNSPIPTDHVYDLEIGPDGALWIATHHNVVRLDYDGFTEVAQGLVTEIAFDLQGELLTATRVFTTMCNVEYSWNQTPYYFGYDSGVASNSNGQSYKATSRIDCFGTASGGAGCWIEHSTIQQNFNGVFDTLEINTFYSIKEAHINIDEAGNLWMHNKWDDYLKKFDILADSFTYILMDTLSINHVRNSAFDGSGNFWMATEKGLVKFDGASLSFHNEGLFQPQLNAIEIDAAGNMYVGGTGIYKYENGVGELWADGMLSNSAEITSNTSGKTAFTSPLGINIISNNEVQSFHIGNSVFKFSSPYVSGTAYVDEAGNVWLHPTGNIDTLYFYNDATWLTFDSTNSNLAFFDFKIIHSDTFGNVWFQNNNVQDSLLLSRFYNGIWTNFNSLDSLYNNSSLSPKIWTLDEDQFAAIKNEGGNITSYPIPDSLVTTNCFMASGINKNGIGLAIVFQDVCNNWSWYHYDKLYFDGTSWTNIGSSTNQYDVSQITFNGNDIIYVKEPYYYQCGPASINIIKSSGQQLDYPLPAPLSIPAPSFYDLLVWDYITISAIDEMDNIWIKNTSWYNGINCHGVNNQEPSHGQVRVAKISPTGVFTFYEGSYCYDFEHAITSITKDKSGRVWLRGNHSTYCPEPLIPDLQTYSCGNDCNTSATACILSGGIGPYNYQWSNGETDPLQFHIFDGSYSITMIDAEQVSDTVALTIIGSNSLTYDYAMSIPTTTTSNDGSITNIFLEGGSPPYQFLWNTGDNTLDLNAIGVGIYELTITDAIGCEWVEFFNLFENIELGFSVINPLCFGDSTGAIISLLDNGIPPYQFEWSNGDSNPNLENLSSGPYQVSVSDSGSYSEVFEFNLSEPDSLSLELLIEYSPTSTVLVQSNLQGGTPPYTYSWSDGSTLPYFETAETGTYFLEATDANGCLTNQTFEIIKHSSTGLLSLKESINLYPNPSNGIITLECHTCLYFSLINSNGQMVTSFNSLNPTSIQTLNLSPLPDGLYLLQIFDANKDLIGFKKIVLLE